MESFHDLANRIDSDSESEEISTADSGKNIFLSKSYLIVIFSDYK